MRKDNFRPHRSMTAWKILSLTLALVLLVGGVVSGTVAWLTGKTAEVVNVFTTSGIGVTLEETTTQEDYRMIPGWTIEKDPKAMVTSGSEDCYLFVKVQETGGDVTVGGRVYTFDSFLAYAIDDGWTALDAAAYPGVYYRVIDEEAEKNAPYSVLGSGVYTDGDGAAYRWAEDQVLTKPEVTREMMEAAVSSKPRLSFTAYAVQLWKANKPAGGDVAAAQFTAEEAWLKIG